jgi:glycosyltransferase involved in cell wall biosynthesis
VSKVDVVVPCYNYGRFLEECVHSVLSQDVDVRVLIIDDASTDDTPSIGRRLTVLDSRVKFIRHDTNQGHINTYNEGIDWASADFFLILSADDYLLPSALFRATALMDEHPEVGFTFGNALELSDSGTKMLPNRLVPVNGPRQRIWKGVDFVKLSLANVFVATCTAVIRTSLQKRVGYYRHELPHSGDMEMWLRLAAHSSVGFLSAIQGVYRQHDSNMAKAYYSHNALGDLQQRKAALDCFFETCIDALPDQEWLRSILFWSLRYKAIKGAAAALKKGEIEEFKQFSNLVVNVRPTMKGSLAWMKVVITQRLGL